MDSADRVLASSPEEIDRLRALFDDPRTAGLPYPDLHRHIIALDGVPVPISTPGWDDVAMNQPIDE